MRTIEDDQGQTWDVAVGKESYGNMLLLFSQRVGSEIRKGEVLAASSHVDAAQELDAMSDDELRSMLNDAPPWS